MKGEMKYEFSLGRLFLNRNVGHCHTDVLVMYSQGGLGCGKTQQNYTFERGSFYVTEKGGRNAIE